MLFQLKTHNIGWAKSIRAKLADYELEQDWEKIREHNKSRWRHTVSTAVREKNKQKLLDSLVQRGPTEEKIKTKTAYIYHDINKDSFSNEALTEITSSNKVNTKTIILARCGMLECGKNFKGTIPDICRECGVVDDESHRLNRCVLWKHLNFSETANGVDFGTIYVNDYVKLLPVIQSIHTSTT